MISTAQDAQGYAHTHVCGECGGWLRTPFKDGGYVVLCGKNRDHVGQTAKRDTTFLLDPVRGRIEVDVMTQQEVGSTAIVQRDEASMRNRVQKAVAIGKFPSTTTPEQQLVLANVAWAYGLDPLMGELIPYHGHPYITIDGRRRLDNDAGHKPKVCKFRFLTDDEKAGYAEAGVLIAGDLAQICMFTTEWGDEFEAFGKCTVAERESRSSPIASANPIEMAQKRAEMRARKMAYGPVPRPAILDQSAVVALEEGDESGVVESTGEIVDNNNAYVPATPEAVEALEAEMDGRLI